MGSRTLLVFLIISVTTSSLYYKYNVYCGCLAFIHARQAIYSEISSVQVCDKTLENSSPPPCPYCKDQPSLMLITLREHQHAGACCFCKQLNKLTDPMVCQHTVCDTSPQVCYQASNRSTVSGSLEE